MNIIEKKYPRIYSISTVGVRNHNNSDFLIHPLRTDFTGQSGTGKSLIGADLPQLILTAGKSYKSATKPKGDVSRDYNSMPLSTKDFCYAVMNIEIKQGHFIAIGVMIRRSPKQLYPFIIQSNIGIHPDSNPKFQPLNRIIRYQDFLQNGEILSIDNLKRHLDEQGVYLTSFYHNSQAYHKLLFLNKILHLDLSADENLQRQYAHTLQSLARGEDIDTAGNKFKRFLFHYDDEVAEKFRNQAKAIEEDHRKYEEDWKAQHTLSKKKDVLTGLVSLKKDKIAAFETRIMMETSYYRQQVDKNEMELKKATKKYLETKLETIAIKERKILMEVDRLENDKTELAKDLKNQESVLLKSDEKLISIEADLKNIQEVLPNIEREKDELRAEHDKCVQVRNWLKVYSTIEAIKGKFELQAQVGQQKDKLEALMKFLNAKDMVFLFNESEYVNGVKTAIEQYKERKELLQKDIANTIRLKEIILNQHPHTFAGWAVSSEIKLSEVQEAILFHFATTNTSFDETNNYIPDPEKFLQAQKNEIKQTKNGFVIDLAGLHYHVSKRENYIFGNPKKLRAEIEKVGKDFTVTLRKLERELGDIQKLELLFTSFNYSQEHQTAYNNRQAIQSFVFDASLKLTEQQFFDAIDTYERDERRNDNKRVSVLYALKQGIYEKKIEQRGRAEQEKIAQTEIRNQSKAKVDILKDDLQKKQNRIIFLKNTELVAVDADYISWKALPENNRSGDHDELFKAFRKKHQPNLEESALTNLLVDLSHDLGVVEGEIRGISNILPTLRDTFDLRKVEYEKHFKRGFNHPLSQEVTNEQLEGSKREQTRTSLAFEGRYTEVVEDFQEDLQENPKMRNHQFDLNTLILELIPHEIISNKDNPEESLQSDIEEKLAKLHQQIKELNKEEAKKIHNTVRDLKRIVEQQITFLERVKALLKDFRLATYHKVLLNWHYSPDYNLKWIDALNKDIESLNFTYNLFGEKTRISAQELLEATFKRYCPTKAEAKANDILNPFNYYEASAIIADPNDKPSPGSAGQNYGMLALLCIAKLSIVEGKAKNIFDKIEPGIRILPIDEVAGLGENFDMLYEIAQKLDYQIFTMTVAANDLTFENGKQIYYEFIKNSDEKLFEYNEGIQACFSKDNLIADIETHFSNSIFVLEPAAE